ncbi:MAG: TolC family protein [Terracidiphilus sp.]|jgi:outer membrane protein TolC
MHLFGLCTLNQQEKIALSRRGQAVCGQAVKRLCAVAAILLAWAAYASSGYAQVGAGASAPDKAASNLPSAPSVALTEPVNLRPSARDFSKPAGRLLGNPLKKYWPTSIDKASFANSVRMTDLVKDGKIYLSLSDALALALENNFDIAIARYNLDIADTDVLRTRAGGQVRGVNSGVVANTLGGSASTLASGGGPGGTTGGSGGAASGSSGLVLSTSGAGPQPENLDPSVSGTVQFDRNKSQQTSIFSPAVATNTEQYNFTYTEGFIPGTSLAIAWNNSRIATGSIGTGSNLASYTPEVKSQFNATVTQHLLQGAGIWVNKRFMYQALNDRRITDASFRQQILFTVNQVESIYWGLVQAYEDVQAKERALAQSTKLASDDRKQLEIGTVAPLQVVQDDSNVNSDKQALITAQSALNYQQQIIKQAVARNLNDPALSIAPVIPTDRVTVEEIPEEKQPVEELVQEAFRQRPELEQAVLQLRNNEITLKGARNALLPTLDAYGYYGATVIGGTVNPNCNFEGASCVVQGNKAPTGFGGVLQDLGNSTAPDKGIGFSLTIPIRNRTAQADQARSLIEYRQAELRLEQLYTQIRMQVVNAQFALLNDRAQVQAANAALQYNKQNVDAEYIKLHNGASTIANVMLQERSLATAEDNLIAANAAYAKDRAGLYQMLASTLQHYGINLNEAASGDVKTTPVIPGIAPAKNATTPVANPPAKP